MTVTRSRTVRCALITMRMLSIYVKQLEKIKNKLNMMLIHSSCDILFKVVFMAKKLITIKFTISNNIPSSSEIVALKRKRNIYVSTGRFSAYFLV